MFLGKSNEFSVPDLYAYSPATRNERIIERWTATQGFEKGVGGWARGFLILFRDHKDIKLRFVNEGL